jgi:hypothetical protein
MNNIVYIVGFIVIVLVLLSCFGLRGIAPGFLNVGQGPMAGRAWRWRRPMPPNGFRLTRAARAERTPATFNSI